MNRPIQRSPRPTILFWCQPRRTTVFRTQRKLSRARTASPVRAWSAISARACAGWAEFICCQLTGEDVLLSHQHVLTSQASLMDETVVRALADPLRMKILGLLGGEQLCTCHLVAETGATQPNISNHLRVLRDAGLIVSEPAGRYTYHRIAPDRLLEAAGALDDLASRARLAVAVKRPCG